MDPLTLNVVARVASSPDQILKLIVQGVLKERNVNRLIEAWEEAAWDDWAEENGEDAPEYSTQAAQNRWEKEALGILHNAREVVTTLENAWLKAYKRIDRQGTGTLESFVWPERLEDKRMAQSLAEAIGTALGIRDGRDAVQMRKYYETHRR